MKSITILLSVAIISLMSACQKDELVPTDDPTSPPVEIKEPNEPNIAETIGFFLDNWVPKVFRSMAFEEKVAPLSASLVVKVDVANVITKIPASSFGHNANTWMTPMVNQPAFMSQITNLKPNLIRWPAGSGSDVYFWDAKPNQLPADVPQELVNSQGVKESPGFMYGNTNDNWRASLDDYYQMLVMSGNKGTITVNYGYARYGLSQNPVATAAKYAADWVRYDKGRTKYWEIGNENFGTWEWGYRIDKSKNKDGQQEILTGDLYAKHFQVFADSMHKAAAEIGSKIYIGAVLFDYEATESWQTNTTKTWNTSLLKNINNKADYYIVHNYFTPYDQNSTAKIITDAAVSVPKEMMTYISNKIVQSGAKLKPVAMTEWNMWAKDAKQQVSNVSGLFAAIVVCESIKNKYAAAIRWDLLNAWSGGNDHGLFSDGNEPGVAKWTARPSFYYMYYLQSMMGDRMVSAEVQTDPTKRVMAYASTYSTGQSNVTLINTSAGPIATEIKIDNFNIGDRYYWYALAGDTDNGEFSRKVIINDNKPDGIAGGPKDYASLKPFSAKTKNGIKVIVPARGAVFLVVDKK